MNVTIRRIKAHAWIAAGIALTTCFGLSLRSASAQALQVMFTLGDSVGTAGDNYLDNAVNSPVQSASASTGATNTIYVWGIVTDSGVADSDLGIDTIYFGGESLINGTGAFSTGAGIGVTAQTELSPWNTLGHTGTLQDLNSDGVTDVGTTSTSTTTGKSGSFSASNNPGTYSLGGASSSAITTSSMPYGATSSGFTGGWAFLIGEFTFTEGTTGSGHTGSTSFNPFVPKFSSALVDTWTTTGSGTGASTAEWTALTGVTFTAPVATSTSVLNLSPSALTFGTLQNGTPVSQSLTLSETSGTGSATYTGLTVGNFSVGPNTVTNGSSSGTGSAGTVASSGSLTFPTTYNGSTGTAGTFTGSYTVANTSGSTATQGNLSATLTMVVGNATTDMSGSGSFNGNVLNASVANGGSYAGLASSSNGGVKQANPNNALPGIEGSTATILLGQNNQGAGMTPSMTWRSRALTETPHNDNVNGAGWPQGTPTSPPLPTGPLPLISDVVNLYGMSAASNGQNPGTAAPVQVDPFAFEVSYNPATLNAEGAMGNAEASHGNLYLASLVDNQWENTIIPDFAVAGGTTATYHGQTIQVGSAATAAMDGNFNLPVLSSFASFMAANDITNANIANYVGDWGVDTTNDEAWAIVNHNSEFAVVPEPSTIALLAIGLAGMAFAAKKRKEPAAV